MADNKKKNQTINTRRNVIESLKDIGSGTGIQAKDLLKNTSEDFFKELFGLSVASIRRTGEISPGETLDMNGVIDGKEEVNKKKREQLNFENNLLSDEKRVSQEKTNKLRIELHSIIAEVRKITESSESLAEAAQISMISAPIEPGIYHINFFENLLTFLQSFRKKIDLAATWLNATNKRAEKKNYWSTYKKKGSSFLLSPDHYLTRSAG